MEAKLEELKEYINEKLITQDEKLKELRSTFNFAGRCKIRNNERS